MLIKVTERSDHKYLNKEKLFDTARYRLVNQVGRVFVNGPGDLGSIPGRVIPKTFKMVLDATLLNTQQYKVRIKWSNAGKGVPPSPTPRCCSYRKVSLLVTLD